MILHKVEQTIEKYRMLARGDLVMVGVSGGMDSVALLSVLDRLRPTYGISIHVVHLNHELRGEESRRDEEFVKDLARRLNLPCESRSIPVERFRKKGMTLQEAAREVRFAFFRSVMEKHGAQKLALGQTADDQAETMVMRFIRGAGLGGLKGIPPVREGFVIHPLIEVGREEIEAYLAARGLHHVEDSSNRKEIYLRNRIRMHLLPLLQRYNPSLKECLVRMGQVFLQEEEYMESKTEELWERVVRNRDSLWLDLNWFRNLHPALQFRLLKRMAVSVSGIAQKRLGVVHIQSLADLARGRKPQTVVHLPGRITARRIYDRLVIGRGEIPQPPVFDHPVALPGTTPIAEIGKRLVTGLVGGWQPGQASSRRVFLDADRLAPELRVRNRRPGDRFRPLGMRGSRKIKDCFIDWKVPMDQRAGVPLVVSGEEIVWVVGWRIGHQARVTDRTQRVVCMEIQDL
ncbi:MAG: tRNA lysidine(34) synthetase TilS [Deltaproteobacteria bacterium]|nr:tRNA lysidine(34) synthetase TilS [Deltaproteobacteria bacterium]